MTTSSVALDELGKTLSLSEIPEAIKTADGLKQLRERVVLTESVLKRWGELAPAEAFAHISEMPEGMMKVESLRSVVPFYAKKDIRAVADAALKMKPGRARTETVQMLVEEWTRQDVKAALKWVNELPEGFPKDGALHNIYFIWVHLDPAGIASTVQNLPPSDTRNALIINVAGDWAAKDAPSAIKWAEGLPVEADKQTALATIAESWADVEPAAAADFALKLSPPELRQRAVLAAMTALGHPGSAAGVFVDHQHSGRSAATTGRGANSEHICAGIPRSGRPVGGAASFRGVARKRD